MWLEQTTRSIPTFVLLQLAKLDGDTIFNLLRAGMVPVRDRPREVFGELT